MHAFNRFIESQTRKDTGDFKTEKEGGPRAHPTSFDSMCIHLFAFPPPDLTFAACLLGWLVGLANDSCGVLLPSFISGLLFSCSS
jgi:hypothetical protein